MASEQIIQALDALFEKFGIAVDWSSQNILPYIQTLCEKFAAYKIAATITEIILGVLFLVIGALLIELAMYCISRENGDIDSCWYMGGVFAIIGAAVLILIGIVSACSDIQAIIKWVTIPEAGLFEYVFELIQ